MSEVMLSQSADATVAVTALPVCEAKDMQPKRGFRAWLGLVMLLVLIALPVVIGGYWTFTLGLCFANAIAILSVSFLVRYSGEVSIGHGVFVAAGAYTVALLEKYLGVSLLVSLPVAAVVGGVLGLAFAFPSRNLSGIYLAVATMALALALPEVLLYFSSVTGGYEGLYVKQLLAAGISPELQRYYLPLAGLVVVALLLAQFRQSRQAIALLLIRTSAPAAESFGIRRSWARLSCMAVSAGIAAIGGAFLAFSSTTVSPNSFTLWTSIFLLVGSVVSLYALGMWGSLIGGIFLTMMPLLLAGAGDWVPILYGGSLLVVVLCANALPEAWRVRLTGGRK